MAYKLEQYNEDILANKAFFSALEQLPVNKALLHALLNEILEAVNKQNLNLLSHRKEVSVLSQLLPNSKQTHILSCVIKIHKLQVLFRLNTTVPVVSFRYQI
ncbi:hypothetical protein [Rheinheimera soli]|uniref:hypothetical protein n=1 Tax=Rheinheimera soli TaxID=443616 RepID=UPI001E29E96D|nr:hypothetical protein [Rheinheimera soli]